jgi:D-arabinose 1-dehydrogenase-like Zn-dependent alcohol dehydrogenase
MNDAPSVDEVVGIDIEGAQPSGAAVGRVDDAPEKSAVLLGKRVLVGPFDPCGQCDVCRRGGASVCLWAKPRGTGGYKRVRASTRWLVALDTGLELPVPAAAAIAGDIALAYTLYARAGVAPRDPVVIVGANAITRFLVEILVAKSITPIVVAAAGDFASWLGSKGVAVADDRESVIQALARQGLGVNRPPRVFACHPETLSTAVGLATNRATLTVLADRPLPDLPGNLLAREVTITSVAAAHPDLFVEAAAMCAKGEIDLVGGTTADPNDHTRALVYSTSMPRS